MKLVQNSDEDKTYKKKKKFLAFRTVLFFFEGGLCECQLSLVSAIHFISLFYANKKKNSLAKK